MAGYASPLAVPLPRGGAAHWVRSYQTLIRWHLAGLRMWLALLATIQVLAGAGFIFGIALFFRHIPATAALFVCTGVPVINLVMVGLILGPQLVAEQKLKGSYDFIRSLPVPRTAAAGAWYAVALTAFTGTMLGYGLGHAIPNPMTTRLITQLLIFAIFGYVPILYPAAQLPGWLVEVNGWLPFGHMAVIVRAGLTTGLVTGVAASYAIVAAWGALGVALSAWALGRRG
jgi:ABC-2 type transport system permease protein